MGLAVDSVKEILKNCINLNAWILALIQIVGGIVAAIAAIIPFVIFFGLGLLLIQINAVIAFAAFLIGFVLFLAIIIVATAFLEAFLFLGGKQLFETKNFELEKIAKNARTKIKPVIKLMLVVGFAWLIIAILLFSPSIIAFINGIKNVNPLELSLAKTPEALIPLLQPLMGAILLFILGLMALSLIGFLISPIAILFIPAIVFEEIGAIGAIKKSIANGKQNYFLNLSIIFLTCLVAFPVMIIQLLLSFSGFDLFGVLQLPFNILIQLIWLFAAIKIYSLNQKAGL